MCNWKPPDGNEIVKRGTTRQIGTGRGVCVYITQEDGNLNRIIITALLLLGAGVNASSQSIPKWELYGGYSEDLAGAGIAGEKQLPSNGVQVEFDG